jgi:hypothetical protein
MSPLKRALSWMSRAALGAAQRPAHRRMMFNAIRLRRPEIAPLLDSRELQFLAYAFSRRDQSKSQILQDLRVCFELGARRNGFCVEFGATDGLTNSNTWLLESLLGWKGFWPNSVEQNKETEGKIQGLLQDVGYVRVFQEYSQWDGWYVAPAEKSKLIADLRSKVVGLDLSEGCVADAPPSLAET